MNFTDDSELPWSPDSSDDLDAFNATSIDMHALQTFLVSPVSAAGKTVGENVVEVIDEAITTFVIVVLVVAVLAAAGAAALVVWVVRRRRRAAVEAANEVEMAELGGGSTTDATLEKDNGGGCEKP